MLQARETADADNAAFRDAIYSGGIFHLRATPASLRLCATVNAAISAALGGADAPTIHDALDYTALSAKMLPLRSALAGDPGYVEALRDVMASAGFDPAAQAVDPLRLRSVMHNGHLSPGSEKAYALHRDTWYGNPQAQVNWWLPLQDVTADQSFAFYPEVFETPLENSSAGFDYAQLVGKAGWQGTKGGSYANYPAARAGAVTPRTGFAARKGDIILFSAAQLHGTCRNASGRTRWSLDFRSVHLADHAAGRGAPNADNGSRPDALASYLMLAS